jgi:sensor histidine kinase YesM
MRRGKKASRLIPGLLFFLIWTLLALLFTGLSYGMALSDGRQPDLTRLIWTSFTRFYIWAALSPLIFYFTRRFPVEFRPLRLGNLLVQIPAVFLFAVIHQTFSLTVGWLLDPRFSRQFSTLLGLYQNFFFGGLYFNLPFALLLTITAHAFLFYRSYRASEVQRSQLKAELARAQLQALKMQLHPHFLFNTLHSISSLVLADPVKANSMIARLGDFLRLTLEHSEQQMVQLSQEIEFLRCYLEIEEVRFQDRLKVEFNIEPTTRSALVPHLILQPIVENAIRHAVAHRDEDAYIKVEAKRLDGSLKLEVKDNGPGLSAGGNSTKQGLGLANARARLEQAFGRRGTINMRNGADGGLTVTLVMPLQSDISARPVAANEAG